MPFIMCPAGHFYNPEQSSSCPTCKEDGLDGQDDRRTQLDVNSRIDDNTNQTLPPTATKGEDSFGHIPTQPDFAPGPGTKEWPAPGGGAPLKPVKTELINPASENKDIDGGVSPVVGWLVIVSGPGTGRDLRLAHYRNRLGRDKDLEVCLDFGPGSDSAISRQANAVIHFEPESGQFLMLFDPNWKTLPRVNGKVVTSTVELNAGDLIEVGRTKLLFVPLCGPKFKW